MYHVRVTIVAVETQQCILCVFTLSHKLHDFRKKKIIEHKISV